jgi:subtilase family serine protease
MEGVTMKCKIYLITSFIFLTVATLSYAALDLKFTTAINLSPTSPTLGDTVTFSVTFKSEGAIVNNLKIIGGVDGAQLFQRIYASIPANGNRTDTFTWTATAGDHSVFFTLDPDKTAGDSNYNNNYLEKIFNVIGGTSVFWEAGAFIMTPAAPKGGDTVTFTHTFKVTQGPVDNLKYILSFNGLDKYSQNWAHLEAGESRTVSGEIGSIWAVPQSVVFRLDPDQTTNDVNRDDNRFEYTFTPQNVGTQLLWQGNFFKMTPASPVLADSITFSISYAVTNAPVDNLKIVAKIDGVAIKETDIAHKETGWNNSYVATWIALTAGTHKLQFILDPNQTTGDTDYSDNTYEYTFSIPNAPSGSKPNLTIKNITNEPQKSKYYVGDKVKISFSLVNDGNKFSDNVKIRVTGLPGSINYTSGILQPGESWNIPFDYIISCKLLEITVDPDNLIQESNEGDNKWSYTFPCYFRPKLERYDVKKK